MGQQHFEKVVPIARQWELGMMAADEFLSSTFDARPAAASAAWLAGPQTLGDPVQEAVEAALRLRLFNDAIEAYAEAALSEAQIAPARQAYWRAWGRLDAQGAERDARQATLELGDPEHGLHAKLGGWSSTFASLAMAWSGAEEDLNQEFDALVAFAERCVAQLGDWGNEGVLHMLLTLAERLSAKPRSQPQRARGSELAWAVLGLLGFEEEKAVMATFDKEARRREFAHSLL